MAFPQKPAAPALQTSHSFASELVGAWLFAQSSGHTVPDYSNSAFHLSGTGYSDGSWGSDGGNATFLSFNLSRLRAASAHANYQHLTSEPWTMIFHLRRTGGPAASFNRIFARAVNNRMDVALNSSDNHAFSFFTGSAWVDSGQSSVSGAAECWAITKDTANVVKVYRDAVEAYSNTHANGHDGQFSVGAPDAGGLPVDQYLVGDVASFFYHRRALSSAEIVSHYSDPYIAFSPPLAPAGGGLRLNFNLF